MSDCANCGNPHSRHLAGVGCAGLKPVQESCHIDAEAMLSVYMRIKRNEASGTKRASRNQRKWCLRIERVFVERFYRSESGMYLACLHIARERRA